MIQLLFQLFVRTIPGLVSVVLSSQSFNRSVLVLAIESQPKLCPDFERQRRNGFPCVLPGATVLSICLSMIGLGITLFTNALLVSDPVLKMSMSLAFAILAVSLAAYTLSYRHELFRMQKVIGIRHGWLGEHIPFLVSLINYLQSIVINTVALVYN